MTVEKTRYAVGEPIALGLALRNISKSSKRVGAYPSVAGGLFHVKLWREGRDPVVEESRFQTTNRMYRADLPLLPDRERIVLEPGGELTGSSYLQCLCPDLRRLGPMTLCLQAFLDRKRAHSRKPSVSSRVLRIEIVNAEAVTETVVISEKKHLDEKTVAFLARLPETRGEDDKGVERPDLFLCVHNIHSSGKTTRILMTENLGPSPREMVPSIAVDGESRIHVLFEKALRHWTYRVYPKDYVGIPYEAFRWGRISRPVRVTETWLVGEYRLCADEDGAVAPLAPHERLPRKNE
ncbi:MAG: hypothetical protein ACYS9X_03600 [Planctomycetota bacterium]